MSRNDNQGRVTVRVAVDENLPIPADFAGRLAAARIYKGYATTGKEMSRDAFATLLNVSGASGKSLQNWEEGKVPDDLKARGLIERLVEVTGLPEEFFYGLQPPPAVVRIAAIEETLRQQAFDANTHAMAVERQLREVAEAIARLQPPQQP